jgi:hypothetical protein
MRPYPNFRDLERLWGITWRDLAELEPELGGLLCGARQACVTCRRWSDVDRAFAPIRNTLAGLVGLAGKNSRHPVLGGPGAYEVAYWKLYDAVAGLLPGRPGGGEGAPEKQRGEGAAETCPTGSAATGAARV